VDSEDDVVGYIVNWSNVSEQMLAETEVARFQACSAPTNVMFADRDLKITVRKSVVAEDLIDRTAPPGERRGTRLFDRPVPRGSAYQRTVLANGKNLPVARTSRSVGTADLLVSAIYDAKVSISGRWSPGLITEKIRYQNELSRTQSIAQNAPTGVMMADLDLTIVYMNPAALEIAKRIETYLPVPVAKMVGSRIDIFHKDPAYQRKILASDKNLPVRANIEIGPEIADLQVAH
jgi:methyl-accepting chemotaxis protein